MCESDTGGGCRVQPTNHHHHHDGYRRENRKILYTSSSPMADALQEIILKVDVASSIRTRHLAGVRSDLGTHIATSLTDGFVVSRSFHAPGLKYRPEHVREIAYDGMVYCADLPPHHLMFTRRDGYCMWSGDSCISKSR